MRVILDTNILVPLLSEIDNDYRLSDPVVGSEVTEVKRRAEALLDRIERLNGTIIIPTPVLAEYLVGIRKPHQQEKINLIRAVSCFETVPFDELAAIECASIPTMQELRKISSEGTANKVKFDRQIIAIALAISADEVWTHDKGVYDRCKYLDIPVFTLSSIDPIPEQRAMDFTHGSETNNLH
ncbi:type II toxin-antitoxin system VapC family toxin [Pantoea agglomerans]|uniref:type II toxin-antitoxin system VapC family toxin n=1 Tax=Enterobacter agglomerans TaxID=549 RepID=UPI003DA0C6A8